MRTLFAIIVATIIGSGTYGREPTITRVLSPSMRIDLPDEIDVWDHDTRINKSAHKEVISFVDNKPRPCIMQIFLEAIEYPTHPLWFVVLFPLWTQSDMRAPVPLRLNRRDDGTAAAATIARLLVGVGSEAHRGWIR